MPVKSFADAKQRLSPLLNAEGRRILAEAMMRDVVRQVLAAQGLDATFVVTADARVSEIASSLGAQIIREEKERGETEAVAFALQEMKQMGIGSVLVLPADLPLLRSSDVECLLEHIPSPPSALLVPSHDRKGTNALLLSPPDVISLRFGYDSFAFHLNEAEVKGARLKVLEHDRIGLDIDEPGDLERFMALVVRVRGSTSSPPRARSRGDSCSYEHEQRARIDEGATYHALLELRAADCLRAINHSESL